MTHKRSCQKRTKCKLTKLEKVKAAKVAEAEEDVGVGGVGVDEDVVVGVVDPRPVTIVAR